METATHWSVDRLAASNLLAQLQMDATEELIDQVARHFAEHRRSLVDWVAERTHSAIYEAMEAAAADLFADHSEEWVRGFNQAEQIIITTHPRNLLDMDPGRPRSKGQILRSMIRQARGA